MNHERLRAQGAMVELKSKIHALDTEIQAHKLFIRDQVAPFVDATSQKAALVLASAQRLHACCEQIEKLKADLAELEADWG